MTEKKESSTEAKVEKKAACAMFSVEALQQEEKTDAAVFAGMLAANGWKAGRQLTREQYRKAEADFLKSPAAGKEGNHGK